MNRSDARRAVPLYGNAREAPLTRTTAFRPNGRARPAATGPLEVAPRQPRTGERSAASRGGTGRRESAG